MNRLELAVRNVLRRAGIASWLVKLGRRPLERRKRALRQDYQRLRPDRATLQVGARRAVLRVANAEEYAHYLAEEEAHIIRAVLDRLGDGDTVWDIGANVGMFTLLMADAVGSTGSVYAFEPSHACFDRLVENAQLNEKANIRPMKLALGSRRQQMELALVGESLDGGHQLVREGSHTSGLRTEAVDVLRGDDLRREQGLAVPNFIKIDVQGGEEDVLSGLSETLHDPACRTVIYEIHFAILQYEGKGDAPLRIERLLQECGFALRRLDQNHMVAAK